MAFQKISKRPRLLSEKTRSQGLPVQKRTEILATKVELKLKEMVEKAASDEGETVSTWIRDAVVKKLGLSAG